MNNREEITYEDLVELLDEMGYAVYEEAADRREDLITGKNLGAIGVAAAAILGGPIGWSAMALPLAISGGAYLISVLRTANLTGKFQAIPFSKESLFSVAIHAASGSKLVSLDQNTDPVSSFMSAGERAIWCLTSRQMIGEYLADSIWGDYEERKVPITPDSIKRALTVAVDAFERNPSLIEDPTRTIALRGKDKFATEFFNGLKGVAPERLLESDDDSESENQGELKKASAPLLQLPVEGATYRDGAIDEEDSVLDVGFEEIEVDDFPESGDFYPTPSMATVVVPKNNAPIYFGEPVDDGAKVTPIAVKNSEDSLGKAIETLIVTSPVKSVEVINAPVVSRPPQEERDERIVNISRELVNPVKSTIILGKPGSGKGFSTSNAISHLLESDPDLEVWFVDPKNDPNEGYFDAFLPPSRMFKRRLPSAIDEAALDGWVEDACHFINKFQMSKAPRKLLIWDEVTNSIAKLGTRFKKYIIPELVDIATMGRSFNSYVWLLGQSDGLADWGITSGSRDVFRRVALINQVPGDINCDGSFSKGTTTFFQQTPLPASVARLSNRVAYDSQRINAETPHGWVPIYSEPPIVAKQVSKASSAVEVSEPISVKDPWVSEEDNEGMEDATQLIEQLDRILEPGASIFTSKLCQRNAAFQKMDESSRVTLLEEVVRRGTYTLKGKKLTRTQ